MEPRNFMKIKPQLLKSESGQDECAISYTFMYLTYTKVHNSEVAGASWLVIKLGRDSPQTFPQVS